MIVMIGVTVVVGVIVMIVLIDDCDDRGDRRSLIVLVGGGCDGLVVRVIAMVVVIFGV